MVLPPAPDPAPTQPQLGIEATIGTPVGRSIRVLLVEDRPVARKLLADELVGAGGIEVAAVARDGDEAVRLVREAQPDIVLLDLVLPGKDGIETLREIRGFSGIPVILLTGANVAPETLEHVARRQGANAFIRKPSGPVSFDMYRITDRLVAEIHRLVSTDEAQTGRTPQAASVPPKRAPILKTPLP